MSSWMSAGCTGGAGYAQNRMTNSTNYSSGGSYNSPITTPGSWMNSDGAKRYEEYRTSFSGETNSTSVSANDDGSQNDSSSEDGSGLLGWYRKRSTGVKILMWTSSVGALGLIIFFTIRHLIKANGEASEKEEASIAQRSTAFKELINQFNERENKHHQQAPPPVNNVVRMENLQQHQSNNGHITNHNDTVGFTATKPITSDNFNYATSMMTDSYSSSSADVWQQLER